jgi:hypothetical protein
MTPWWVSSARVDDSRLLQINCIYVWYRGPQFEVLRSVAVCAWEDTDLDRWAERSRSEALCICYARRRLPRTGWVLQSVPSRYVGSWGLPATALG